MRIDADTPPASTFRASWARTSGDVAPGWVITERQRDLWVTDDSLAAHVAKQCIREVMQPDDMVGTCLFLASDASRMLTAQTLVVDGGYL